ncbi:MAG: hypothetical protein ACE5G3_13365 [Gammaproteobacteria bacterium]
MKTAGSILAILCSLTPVGAALADEESPDTELLEFLGSWEGEDDEWQEFLASLPPSPPEEHADSDMDDRTTESDSN